MKSQLKKFAALFLSLCVALSVMTVASFAGASSTSYYEKVTTAPEDWSGDYLIVYEGGSVALNGDLSTLDVTGNKAAVTIADNKIEATEAVNKLKVTIEKSGNGYTIKTAKGIYIGNNTSSNDLQESTSTKYVSTITLENDGPKVVGSAGNVLRYNATSGQDRFRYFKSTTYTAQKPIALYKYVEVAGGDDDQGGTVTPPPAGGDDDQQGGTTAPTYSVVDTPVAGTAYKFGMDQTTVGKILYANGEMSSYYMATVEDPADAIDVYVEETTGGFYIYTNVAGAKKYLNIVVSGTHVNAVYGDTAVSVFTMDASLKAPVTAVNNSSYAYGTYGTFTTISTADVVKYPTNFFARFYAADTTVTPPPAGGDDDQGGTVTPPPAGGDDDQQGGTTAPTYSVVDTPVAGTAYKFGMDQTTVGKILYANGEMSSYYMATVEDPADAIDVYVEETTGGFYIYTNVAGAKKYLNIVVSGTHVNAVYGDTAVSVFTMDASLKAPVTAVNNSSYAYGTYGTFTTISTADVVKYPTNFFARFYAADTTVTPPPAGGGDDDDNQGGTTPTPTPTEPADGSTLTIPEAIALATPKAKNEYTTNKFMVTGKVVAIASEQYGNLYIADDAGNELYVYGTKGEDGTYFDKLDPKVEVGDTVTLYGPVGKYNDVQMKNAVLKNLVKGQGATNNDPEADSVLTIKEAIELALSKRHDTYTAGKYYVTGTITEIYNEQYGNMKIADKDGNILTLYGTFAEDGTAYAEMANKPVVGDEITIYGIIGQYNGTAQIKNGTFMAASNEDNENMENENEDNKNDGNEDEEGKVEAPDAGDHSSIAFAVMMMLLAAAAFVASKKRV